MHKFIKLTFPILFIVFNISRSLAYDSSLFRTFQADGGIVSSPLIKNNGIYFGTLSGTFYSISYEDLSIKWITKLGGGIKSSPVANETSLFIEAKDTLYSLEISSGNLLWKKPISQNHIDVIDTWDYHHSSPILVSNTVFIGSSNGTVWGFNANNGEELFKYTSINNSPIRSTPIFNGDKVYFGDWNGVIYCVNLNQELSWKLDIYNSEYAYNHAWSSSSILGDMIYYDGFLYFGARNSNLLCLNSTDGNVVWHYKDLEEGWISGTPLVQNDTLFIGGSDTKSILAFNAKTGQKYWERKTDQNCFGRLGHSNKYIAAVTGNSYKANDLGNFFLLKRTDGEVVKKIQLGGNSFTSVVWEGQIVVAGNNDKNLYVFNMDAIVSELTSSNTTPLDKCGLNPYKIYFSPSENQLTIEIAPQTNKVKARIFSPLGSSIQEVKIEQPVTKVPFAGKTRGLYICSLTIDNQHYSSKIIY